MDNELEKRLQKIEKFIDSLKAVNTMPKEVIDALVSFGFLKFEKSLYYEAGAGGNAFETIVVKYKNGSRMLQTSQQPRGFVVKSLSGNTVTLIGSDIADLSILEGSVVTLYTDGVLPGGLDLTVPISVLNATVDSFQLSTDGVNPIDITSNGTGNQYITFF